LRRAKESRTPEVILILYFNVGLKPYPRVKDETARFMAEVASTFA
jgi:hypothetical protein